MSRKRPTIVDVAGEAGVSTGTVSNVLNGSTKVAAATRTRVEAAIERLGYVPDPVARSLTTGRRGKVAAPVDSGAPHLVAVGYLSADYTARVDVLPHRDDRITARSIEKSLGGPAANVAVMAASFGAPYPVAVELITAIGDDPDSDWALVELAEKKVDTMGVRRRRGERLSRCIVLVEPNGSRTIVNEPFVLDAEDLRRYVRRVDPGERVCCVHLEGYQLDNMLDSVRELRAMGWRTSLQATGLATRWLSPEGLRRIVGQFDVLFINRDAARAMTGCRGGTILLLEQFRALLAACPRGLVILTLGEEGAAILEPESESTWRVPALATEVVDTTGAGDTYASVFLAGWLNGATAAEAARAASVAASLSIGRPGAQGFLPRAATVFAALRQLGACERMPPRPIALTSA